MAKQITMMMNDDAGADEVVNVLGLQGVPEWMKQGLAALDGDGNGELSKQELLQVLQKALEARARKANNAPEIDYRDFPESVKDVLRGWDSDGGGTVSVGELAAAAKAQAKLSEENRVAKKVGASL